MLSLLKRPTKRWSPDNGPIPFVTVALHLAPALTATLEASMVVGIELLTVGHAVDLPREGLANQAKFPVSLVPEHVQRLIVQCTVGQQHSAVGIHREAPKPTVRESRRRTVDDTLREHSRPGIDGITTASGGQPSVLEVGRSW